LLDDTPARIERWAGFLFRRNMTDDKQKIERLRTMLAKAYDIINRLGHVKDGVYNSGQSIIFHTEKVEIADALDEINTTIWSTGKE
jgi:hypothetical protein